MIEKVLPAIITVTSNIIFYLVIKGRVDKSIEKNKIAYSGLFTEKINIYRELLSKTYNIKKSISRFSYFGTKEEGDKIMQSINEYIHFYQINQPFLSKQMLEELNKLRTEFQIIFDRIYLNLFSDNENICKDSIEAVNKLKSNQPFEKIENRIILEMQKDLKIENFS